MAKKPLNHLHRRTSLYGHQCCVCLDVIELIAETRELDAKATAGPWRAGVSWKDCVMVPHHTGLAGPGGERVLLRMNDNYPHEHDAALIARYRTLAPQLAEALEMAEERAEEAESKVRWFVARAADEKLDGYRRLGARAADAENKADRLQAENARLRKALRLRELDGCDDDSLTCPLCGGDKCDASYETRAAGCRITTGLHRSCARAALTEVDDG